MGEHAKRSRRGRILAAGTGVRRGGFDRQAAVIALRQLGSALDELALRAGIVHLAPQPVPTIGEIANWETASIYSARTSEVAPPADSVPEVLQHGSHAFLTQTFAGFGVELSTETPSQITLPVEPALNVIASALEKSSDGPSEVHAFCGDFAIRLMPVVESYRLLRSKDGATDRLIAGATLGALKQIVSVRSRLLPDGQPVLRRLATIDLGQGGRLQERYFAELEKHALHAPHALNGQRDLVTGQSAVIAKNKLAVLYLVSQTVPDRSALHSLASEVVKEMHGFRTFNEAIDHVVADPTLLTRLAQPGSRLNDLFVELDNAVLSHEIFKDNRAKYTNSILTDREAVDALSSSVDLAFQQAINRVANATADKLHSVDNEQKDQFILHLASTITMESLREDVRGDYAIVMRDSGSCIDQIFGAVSGSILNHPLMGTGNQFSL